MDVHRQGIPAPGSQPRVGVSPGYFQELMIIYPLIFAVTIVTCTLSSKLM